MNKNELENLLRHESVIVIEKYKAMCEGAVCDHYNLKIKHEGAFGFPAAIIDTCVTLPDGKTYKWYAIKERAQSKGIELCKPSELKRL